MTTPSIAKLDSKKIDEIFSTVNQCQLPGLAVGIAIEGVPVYRKGFGLANIELPVALTPSMKMRIGSTTKHFACFAYLLLCEEGLAGLDDEIGKHIPELHAVTRRATMRQLMGHTSGIREVIAISINFNGTGQKITEEELLDYYRTIDSVDFEPGAHWSYNNGAYMLLSIAIERITGQALEDVLRKRIFEPVGMHDTMLRRWDTDFVPNSATLHTVNTQGAYTRDYMGMELSGAGGMVSSMDDMLRWMKHMDAPVVGSAETWKTMKEPHVLARGASTGYGLGLISGSYRGRQTLSHAGGVMGGNSQMIKVPSAKLDLTIAINRADLNALEFANKIIDSCIEDLAPVPEAPARTFEGVYASRRNGRVIALTTHENLQLVSIDGASPIPMTFDADGMLHPPSFMSFMKQYVVPSDASLRFIDFGDEDVLEPLTRDSEATLGAHAGTYVVDLMDIRATVSQGASGARLDVVSRHGGAKFKLEPITQTIWKATALGPLAAIAFILTFGADGQSFNVTAARMPNIIFRRAD
jgi:CubicO group peptidase (beta-lactamase class C family)